MTSGPNHRRQPISRSADRAITALAIALAGAFVLSAGASLLLPSDVRQGSWMPLHLLLAGGAATAIAGVMPYFSAAVAMAPPAGASLRLVAVLAVATGASLVALSRAGGGWTVFPGAVGGTVYLLGFTCVGLSTLLPLRRALGQRRWVLGVSYGGSVVAVMLGAALGTLLLAGWPPVVDAWDALKPAHAWLNTFGFVSLVIGSTLIHLLPTVAAARITAGPAPRLVIGGLVLGPLLTASGFLVRSGALAVIGAGLTMAASLALAWYGLDVVRRRGRWTTDLSWHRFALWSLIAAIAWFVVATTVAAIVVLRSGATAAGWDLQPVVVPLALGWIVQTLFGSWTHLVPSIGPGSPTVHARQRRILGRLDLARFWTFQAGVAVLAVALPSGLGKVAVVAALVMVAGPLALSLALLAGAGIVLLSTRRTPSGA